MFLTMKANGSNHIYLLTLSGLCQVLVAWGELAYTMAPDSTEHRSGGLVKRVKDICTGTNDGMTIVKDTPERRIQALRNRYEGCQYVEGNLEITGLDTEQFYNADLSFLNSIREVTGYVLIANVYAQNVTLKNLTIIWGYQLFVPHKTASGSINDLQSRGYALFVSLNYTTEGNSIGMRLLELQNLAEISNGDVFFENNNQLCYATTDIYWSDIFSDSRRQVSFINNTGLNSTSCVPTCHSSCQVTVPLNNEGNQSSTTSLTKPFCWGPGPKNCQKMNKVTCTEQCEGSRCFDLEPSQCCHAECVGGCDGPTQSDCWGCRNFYDAGGCVPYCPLKMIYDSTNFKWVMNPDRKFSFGKLCVDRCPENFLEYQDGCVQSCPMNYEPKGTKCEKCNRSCPKKCRIRWDASMDFLNSRNIKELEGCVSIDGHLKILESSIKGDPYNDIKAMNLTELENLRSIKEITEYLVIQNLNGLGITNFSFLSNLESIGGTASDAYSTSLNIMNNQDLEFLGFTSLKKILSGHVIIQSNPKLCYVDGLKWNRIFKANHKQTKFRTHNVNNAEQCVKRNKICHSECRNGCWGPGADMCLNCQHYRYNNNGECLFNCSRPMLFTFPDSKKRCYDCSPECSSTCTGLTADKCDACRHYKDGPFCVSKCPQGHGKKIYKYPDSNKVCQPCHANCVDGCTGPENTVGPNGCHACKVSVAAADDSTIKRCLNETESCPEGYFISKHPPRGLLKIKEHIRSFCIPRAGPRFSTSSLTVSSIKPTCIEREIRANVRVGESTATVEMGEGYFLQMEPGDYHFSKDNCTIRVKVEKADDSPTTASTTTSAQACTDRNISITLSSVEKNTIVEVSDGKWLTLEAGTHKYTDVSDGNCTITINVEESSTVCSARNIFVVLLEGETNVNVELSDRKWLTLAAGIHKYTDLSNGNCTITINAGNVGN